MNAEQFKQLRLSKGLTQAKVAKILDLSVRQVGNLEYGITPLSDLYVEKIATYQDEKLSVLKDKIKDIESGIAPDMIEIKYHADIHTAAGYGALNGEAHPETLYFPSIMLRSMFGINDFKDLEIINVVGDSMEPIVSNGETILIKRMDSAKNNQTVIVRVGEHLLLKKFQVDPLKRWIRLTSENELYKAMDFSGSEMDEVQVVGILVGKFKPY